MATTQACRQICRHPVMSSLLFSTHREQQRISRTANHLDADVFAGGQLRGRVDLLSALVAHREACLHLAGEHVGEHEHGQPPGGHHVAG
ncbi:hypothetical protein MRX96_059440 [Rhipicephalus microplus]